MCIMLQCDHTARCSAVLMFNWVVLLFRSWQKLTIALLFQLDRVDIVIYGSSICKNSESSQPMLYSYPILKNFEISGSNYSYIVFSYQKSV